MKNFIPRMSSVAIVMCISTMALGAQPSGSIEKVTASDKTVVLLEHGKEHKYQFADDELVMYGIDEVKLLLQSRAGRSLYVLLDARGASRAGGSGQCGAGEEEYLLWLNLDAKWEVKEQKLELIASCFMNIESSNEESYELSDGKVTAEYEDYNEHLHNKLTCDSAKPEKGWVIEKTAQKIK
jgi:hypothetical protein